MEVLLLDHHAQIRQRIAEDQQQIGDIALLHVGMTIWRG
jgi:hypothetical protein